MDVYFSVLKVRNENMFHVWEGRVRESTYTCSVTGDDRDLKCAKEWVCFDGCFTVGAQNSSCECASCHSTCGHCGKHVTPI